MRAALLLPLLAAAALAETPGMFRFPNAHGDRVVFTSEGDLWIAPLAGGEARRLTSAPGKEHHPAFSPDGQWVAFTGEYEGGSDVYVMPVSGGVPQRLTWNPDADRVVGWTPDGRILYRFRGDLPFGNFQLATISPSGGDPQVLPLGEAMQGSFSSDGRRCAFVMWMWENQHWKRYAGGLAADIWAGDLEKKTFVKLTDWKGNDAYPMWWRERVYFLSDRDGQQNLWSCTSEGKDFQQHTRHKGLDARFPSLGDGRIAYQHGADVRVYDIGGDEDRAVAIRLPSDRLQARGKIAEPAKAIESFSVSPDGTRLVAGARGEAFTVPFREGRILNLTATPGTRERAVAWSPDGKKVAWLSDATGEYEIGLADPTGASAPTQLTKTGSGWKLALAWSPDSKKIAFGDMRGDLLVADAATGVLQAIDHSDTWEITDYAWSPDSRFLAWSWPSETWNGVIRVHDTKDGTNHDVTEARWHSFSPAWDPDGRFLAFLSARSVNPKSGDFMYEYNFSVDDTVKPYLVALKAGDRAPFLPKEGGLVTEEKAPKKRKAVEIDWDGVADRVAQVPVKPGRFSDLGYVKDRLVWLTSTNLGWAPDGGKGGDEEEKTALDGYTLTEKKRARIAAHAEAYRISGDGKRIVVRAGEIFTRMDIGAKTLPVEPEAQYRTAGWTVPIDPEKEWKQIFDEVWRLERDFFYDPHHHKVDWAAMKARYEPLLPRVSSRDELNDLIGEMIAELSNSHAYISGGDDRKADRAAGVGSLGARLAPDAASGQYRFARILRGDPWDPRFTSPLPAAGVREGDYLLAIDGQPVKAGDGWQRFLVAKADKPVLLTVNSKPGREGARDVYVKTLSGEGTLVYRDWVETNRRYVAEKSGGKVGYVHIPDMGGTGLVEFSRQFFWQSDKDALVIDVRANAGGNTHGMLLERLRRTTTHFDKPRHFRAEPTYWRSVRGHLVALINHDTASDGENFTHAWKHYGMGPVIGTRTWGGLVGYRGDKSLVDGGFNAQPEYAHYGWDGKWIVEGPGCSPDIEVVNDPASMAEGKDRQLDAAIEKAMEAVSKDPRTPPGTPEYEDRSK